MVMKRKRKNRRFFLFLFITIGWNEQLPSHGKSGMTHKKVLVHILVERLETCKRKP